MKKNFSLIVLFLLATSRVIGQSVSLDKHYLDFTYRNLPSFVMKAENRTFSVSVNLGENAQLQSVNPQSFVDAINIDGFTYANEHATVSLSLEYSGIVIKERGVSEIKHEERNSEGKTVKVSFTYVPFVVYDYVSKYFVDGSNGEHFYTSNIHVSSSSADYRRYTGREFAKHKDAADYLKLNEDVIMSQISPAAVNEAISFINKEANQNFGYNVIARKVSLWYLGSKKHPEYLQHQSNYGSVRNIIWRMNSDGGLDVARREMAPCIEYLEGLKAKYSEDSKKGRKMRFASFYNLGIIYLMLDMPEEAIAQAKGLVANDYEAEEGEYIVKKAEELKKSFEVNATNTRHFPITWLSEK